MPFKDKADKAEYDRRRYEAKREETLARVNRDRKENPEKIAEIKRRHRLANLERIAEADRRYYEANKEKIIESARRWREANPEKVKVRLHRYRIKRERYTDQGDFTYEQWRLLCVKYNYTCLCCGTKAEDTPEGTLTIDHVIPLGRGGSNHISNIQPLCKRCNSKKHLKSTDYRF